MTPDELVTAAIEVAEEGMAAGELPIGAVVVAGSEVVGRAFTRDRATGQRLVHADLLAMQQADELLAGQRAGSGRAAGLRLAVTLEPCLMCLGAAMAFGVAEVYFGLESPGDGAAGVAAGWQPHDSTPWFRAPSMVGGVRGEQCRELFRRYCQVAPESGFRRWAETLVTPAGAVGGAADLDRRKLRRQSL